MSAKDPIDGITVDRLRELLGDDEDARAIAAVMHMHGARLLRAVAGQPRLEQEVTAIQAALACIAWPHHRLEIRRWGDPADIWAEAQERP